MVVFGMRYLTPLSNIAKMLMYDHLQIEPTTRCNLSCKTCTHRDGVPLIDITLETLAEILSKHHNIRQINLQGLGEPLMHPNFETICHIASQYSRIVQTYTNGTILKTGITKYLDKIVVSLDTLDSVAAMELKGKGYNLYDVTYNILQYACRIPVEINFTQSYYNYRELPEVRLWCKERGLDLNVTRVQNWTAPDESLWDERHLDVVRERSVFGNIPRLEPFCQWKHTRWYYYRADGIRNPCCRRLAYREYTEECCRTCPD
jgi:MoaA/NifB/PqqE/SkfB family radical SAM enzyme